MLRARRGRGRRLFEQALYLLTDMRLACVALTHPLKLLWQVTLRDVVSLDTSPTDALALRLRE